MKVGNVARFRGRVTKYKGWVQITVTDVVGARDMNVEVFVLG